MSRLCVMICRIEDENEPERLRELARVDLPEVDPQQWEPGTALDHLETQILNTGQVVMRHLLHSQWEEVDRSLVEEYQRLFPPRECQTGWI